MADTTSSSSPSSSNSFTPSGHSTTRSGGSGNVVVTTTIVEQQREEEEEEDAQNSNPTATDTATATGTATGTAVEPTGLSNDDEDDDDDEEEGGSGITTTSILVLPEGYWNNTFCDLISLESPDRMKLTQNELVCSMDIKRLIEGCPQVDSLSDYWYAQMGIIGQGDTSPMESAMARAIGIQIYRQRYGITDTLDQGKRSLQWVVDTMPEFLLSMTYSQGDATWVFVGYLSQLNLLDTPDKVQKYFVALWYWHQAILSSDFHTIRKGSICAWECYGMGCCWGFREIAMKIGRELGPFYPCTPRIKCYRTNSFANALVSMYKRVIDKNFRDKLEVGLETGSRLDKIFLVPNAKVASQSVLRTLVECLDRRYKNEKKFVLPQMT